MSFFACAEPVWAEGRETEMDLTCDFSAGFYYDGGKLCLTAAASTTYRFFVNGVFCGAGPARGPRGSFRVDEWDITDKAVRGQNRLTVEVFGINVNSYQYLDQPSFLQAELTVNGEVIAATGTDEGFVCTIPGRRVQKVQRYSFQRPFCEVWRLDTAAQDEPVPVKTTAQREVKLIPRGLPPYSYPFFPVKNAICRGSAARGKTALRDFRDRSLTGISEKLRGYREDELEVHLSDEALSIAYDNREAGGDLPLEMCAGSYVIADLGLDKTGYIQIDADVKDGCEIYLLFDEVLTAGDVDFIRGGCCSAVKLTAGPGSFHFISAEPYTMRYLKVVVLGGCRFLRGAGIVECVCPLPVTASFDGTPELNRIYAAAVETFRQNCVDIFMDCPSRERAGWLCDSFFTARTEFALTGSTAVERNFLENFMLADSFPCLPEGMLPMCYPADHYDGVFIPNWALWFVLQLAEYSARGGSAGIVTGLKGRVYKLFDYFRPFENEYGLLEDLESWIFIEWSRANEFTQDVNFPTNMLYAAALGSAGRLYGDEALTAKAARLRRTIRELSFDGEFFVDNAERENGKLILTGERSETCQYYAFFFDVADRENYSALFNRLTDEFGPDRAKTGAWPEIYESNSFVGNYLRLDILSRSGLVCQMKKEAAGYFLYMAEKTGTLWENISDCASCDHGFASYIACLLLDDR